MTLINVTTLNVYLHTIRTRSILIMMIIARFISSKCTEY